MNRGKFLLFSLEKNFPLSWIEENFSYPQRKLFLYPGQRKIFPMFSLGKDFPLSQVERNVPYVFVRKNFSSILDEGKFLLCFPWENIFLYPEQRKIFPIFYLGCESETSYKNFQSIFLFQRNHKNFICGAEKALIHFQKFLFDVKIEQN